MKKAPGWLLALCLLLIGGGCQKEQEASPKEPIYGEPVGIQMEASQGVPAFEVVIAVTKGVDIDPIVPPLSGLIHKALKACPDVIRSTRVGEPIQLALAIEQGATKDAAVGGSSMDPCLPENLNGQPLAAAPPGRVDALAMLRFGGANAGAPAKP